MFNRLRSACDRNRIAMARRMRGHCASGARSAVRRGGERRPQGAKDGSPQGRDPLGGSVHDSPGRRLRTNAICSKAWCNRTRWQTHDALSAAGNRNGLQPQVWVAAWRRQGIPRGPAPPARRSALARARPPSADDRLQVWPGAWRRGGMSRARTDATGTVASTR
jgi:hypothetical protein